ncbi:phospholipase [Saccharomonospora sp. CUA-673]|uniref:alpha/beta hydrolase n=1 Tax=Saccharomonospora sp. CUA-673 TaxID=1904969 RepID=UPI000967E4A9|nr:phospholipase [Saccharomonospora sp. CUA-673]OLT42140.1 phospholipase [Saccharomonospora sp. CUA-673]
MNAAPHEWGVAREQARVAVLTVHGRGQDPAFMQDVAGRFGTVPARFYAPEADGNTWYPLSFLEPADRNEPALDRALQTMETTWDSVLDAGFDADRIVLWGFSQGACLLSHWALTAPRRVAGIVLFTGGYIGDTAPPAPADRPLHGVPTVMRSIERDPWVPRHRVDDTAELLRHAGAHVDLRIDPGDEHIITDEACTAAGTLLRGV